MAAIYYKNKEVLEYLFDVYYSNHIFKVRDMLDRDQRNILHLAVLSNDHSVLDTLLNYLKQEKSVLAELLKGQDVKENTALHLAAKFRSLDHITEKFVNLITSDDDLLIKNELGQTAFHVACLNGNQKMVEVLYERDAKEGGIAMMNQVDIEHNRPLHLAVANKVTTFIIKVNFKSLLQCSNIVKLLLDKGADPGAVNSIGWNVLCSAAVSGDIKSAKVDYFKPYCIQSIKC